MLAELKNLGMFIISSKLDLDGHKLNLNTTSLLLHVALMWLKSLYLGYVNCTSTLINSLYEVSRSPLFFRFFYNTHFITGTKFIGITAGQ